MSIHNQNQFIYGAILPKLFKKVLNSKLIKLKVKKNIFHDM